ncbi:transposase [Clostridium sp. OS1-26]|uniref:RNA-guided endonuclease InsQ/TnpB family protein n=1 Tax=Clostridium sp. OS1-26 TaxID=3070681 RepID=UPI0027E1204E|nr:transposase [Clostridium sp. OS1-26]WML35660.1 transposase [Clostridium sp. OS1-26]
MMNKCIKVAIKHCDELDMKLLDKILKDISYKTWKACNRAMTYFYTFTMKSMIYKDTTGKNIDEKKTFGKTHGAWIENQMNEIMNICNSRNVAQTRQFVSKRFNDDKKKGLLKGDVAITNFKKNIAIIIHNKSFKVTQGNKGYEIECSLFNSKYQKKNNIAKLTLLADRIDNSKKATLNKLATGIYKQCASKITQDKKGKWYFHICFSFEPNKKELDSNRILGVDLGIINVATMQIFDSNLGIWDKLSWNECILDGRELIHYRQKIEQRYHDLFRSSKIAGNGRTGHGRLTRIQPANRYRNKISNFRNTLNHKYSRYIVDFTVKHNCGIIQMEDLKGFNPENKFLKQWAYYDLQQKIQYKAEEKGIIVMYKKPFKTSQRCSICGCINEENRDCKNNQSKFKCVVCGYEENADINAAKNLSIPNIEDLIEEQLKAK